MISLVRGLAQARPYLLEEHQSLIRLAEDLLRIFEGQAPTPEELWSAPMLENWQLGANVELQPTLMGQCSGHSRLPDGPIHTSTVVVFDEQAAWARTRSRFYALGRQHRES